MLVWLCVCVLSLVLEAVRAELRALGALLTPCGEVCASKKGTRASAAARSHTDKYTHTHFLHLSYCLLCVFLTYSLYLNFF